MHHIDPPAGGGIERKGADVNFDLKKPCQKCPFRTDCLKGWLGGGRAEEIVDALFQSDQTFACHETTKFDDDGEDIPGDHEQHCAGAMILMEKQSAANQMMRIGERLGMYDRSKLDMESPVFDDECDFIDHHTKKPAKKRKPVKKR